MRHRHLALPLALVSLFGCDLLKPKIDQKLAAGIIESILTKENLKAQSITCPPNQEAKKGNVFECTATVEGTEIHFAMEVLDDKGTVSATPRDFTLVVSKIEPEIAADLKAAGHDVASIDCHGDVWVAVTGATVTCDVTDEAGTKYLWTATFIDDKGTHEHSIAPV